MKDIIKFKYVNNNNEEAIYTGEVLTSAVYEKIIISDKEMLTNIANGREEGLSSQEHLIAAKDMLSVYGLNRQTFEPKDKNTILLLIQDKQLICEDKDITPKIQTIKAQIRKKLPSSSIRMFKRDKMNLVLASE